MTSPPKRPNYFAGQVLTADDFRAEQEYHRKKRQLLNRMLHGYGVVCGLRVVPARHPARVIVEPGLALDAAGREIVLPEPAEVDLAARPDGDARQERDPQAKRFIALEYAERETDLAPVAAPGDEEARRPTRIEEGYRLSVRSEPTTLEDRSRDELEVAIADAVRVGGSPRILYRLLARLASRPCPPVPADCALTLAAVEPGEGRIGIQQIDNSTHRRVVLSSARVLEALRT